MGDIVASKVAAKTTREDCLLDDDGLNGRQRLFIEYYLIDLNATNACIKAGYSKVSAHVRGLEILRKPCVERAVQKAMDRRAKRVGITAEKVLANIERISGKAEDAEDYGAALKGQELLGKHLRLFGTEIPQDALESLANRMIAAQERLRLCYSQQQKTIDVTGSATITKPEQEQCEGEHDNP
jgi:phage terminase small subunit